MPEFNQFMAYLSNHINEIAYDIKLSFSLLDISVDALTDQQLDDVERVSQAYTIAILRQYHNWLVEQAEGLQ